MPTKSQRNPPRRLLAARAMIAAIFFLPSDAPAPPIAAWKAWLFIAWIGVTLAAYALSMISSAFS